MTELVSEAPLRTQRAVCFSCWKIFEVKQSSVKKERVFHTQECKMLHSHSAEIKGGHRKGCHHITEIKGGHRKAVPM